DALDGGLLFVGEVLPPGASVTGELRWRPPGTAGRGRGQRLPSTPTGGRGRRNGGASQVVARGRPSPPAPRRARSGRYAARGVPRRDRRRCRASRLGRWPP